MVVAVIFVCAVVELIVPGETNGVTFEGVVVDTVCACWPIITALDTLRNN